MDLGRTGAEGGDIEPLYTSRTPRNLALFNCAKSPAIAYMRNNVTGTKKDEAISFSSEILYFIVLKGVTSCSWSKR